MRVCVCVCVNVHTYACACVHVYIVAKTAEMFNKFCCVYIL